MHCKYILEQAIRLVIYSNYKIPSMSITYKVYNHFASLITFALFYFHFITVRECIKLIYLRFLLGKLKAY
jgi:hypothetical protein